MRSVMETVFGRGNSAIIEMELEAARRRIEEYDDDWADDRDEWPGTFGSDESAHEVFRFVFRAQELVPPGEELMGSGNNTTKSQSHSAPLQGDGGSSGRLSMTAGTGLATSRRYGSRGLRF